MAGKPRFSLFSLLSLLFLSHAVSLSVLPSDHHSLSLITSHLSLPATHSPCSTAGITCSLRYTTRSSAVLRITKIKFKSKGLTGTLSSAIGNLSELEELSLAGNSISGELPPEISSLVNLRVLDLSNNRFSGNLSFLDGLHNLETVSLSNNLLSGKVPESIRSLPNLKVLDLSGNRLLGGPVSVPNREQVSKRYIFAENPMVKNPSSTIAATPTASLSASSALAPGPAASATTKAHKKHKKNAKRMALGFLVGSVGGILSGLLFTALYRLVKFIIRGREKKSGPSIYSPLIKKAEDLSFLEREDDFSSLEIIGRGGCGEVYKAELPGSNGKLLAIKKIVQPSIDPNSELSEEETKSLNKFMRQVKSEIQTVGHIRHRNLLPLLAHVPRPDCQFLVYEYMKNGSLHDLLYQYSQGTRELDWLTRHNIALGVASGLEYLHMNHNPRIIHRDLKPANILLGDDTEARITDFGLAKAMPNMDTHVSTSKVAGTVGYIAPEYHQTLKFTDKCDIYSFGVVLGVLVIGKLPSDEFFQHTSEMSLVRWMRNVMTSKDPTVAIDPKLKGDIYDEQMLLVLKIACFCTLDDPKQRPNSKDIRCMLSQIVH